jgi:choline dehydrogenase
MRAYLQLQLLLALRIAAQNTTFDYVIVGAGTAGLVIANRLSQNPKISIAVIEPGNDVRDYPGVNNVDEAGINFNASIDWAYNSTAQPQLGGRILPWHAGKAIGGTSTINGMHANQP